MSHGVGHLKYSLLREQRLHFVSGDDVAFLERFDRKVLAGVTILRQDHLGENTTLTLTYTTVCLVETHTFITLNKSNG